MTGCCDPSGYERVFGPRFARHLAARYRKRGLDGTAERMVAFLESQGLEGCSVLEVGGGVGDLQLELLRRGARSATNLELSPAYDRAATQLAEEAGVVDRVSRRVLDLAGDPEAVEPADVVVLHRVVCCYPDYPALLSAAAGRARRLLVFSHPRRNRATRAWLAVENAWFALRGRGFRTFAHPPERMRAVVSQAGLDERFRHDGRVWQVAGFARVP